MSNRRSITLISAPSADRADVGGRLAADEERLLRLARVIEGEIIPRLLISMTVAIRTAGLMTAELRDPHPSADRAEGEATGAPPL